MDKKNFELRLVIDTDAGIDDAQAILMALNSPRVQVMAITTCHGNTNAAQVYRNVLRLLKMANRLDIPVYTGCPNPIMGQHNNSAHYHGQDGFGDVPEVTNDLDKMTGQKEHAVNAIIRLTNMYKGELTLVSLAPPTNIALAIRMDPNLGDNLKNCYMMGGNYQGKGNVTPYAEFNFYADPEAAKVVLEELSCPLYLVPWELCIQHSLTWEFYNKFTSKPTEAACFLRHIEAKTVRTFYLDKPSYITADQIAIAALLDPESVIREKVTVTCTVATADNSLRGMMLVDWNSDDQRRAVELITRLDHEAFERLLMTASD